MVHPTTAPTHRELLLEGIVTLAGPMGGQVKIRGVGERVELDIDRSLVNTALISRLAPRAYRRRWLLVGQQALDMAQVSVDLLVGGVVVGRYDWQTKGSTFARLLGLGPIDISLWRLGLALVRRS